MFSLAVADFQSIIFDGIVEELIPLLGFTLSRLNGVTCAVFNYLSNMTTAAAIWITALFSVDKCLAVLFPFKYKEIGKPKICIIATIFVYVSVAFLLSPVLFVFDLDRNRDECRVSRFDIISRFIYFEVRLPITVVVIAIIPILTVIVCTLTTIIKLRLNRRNRVVHGEGAQTSLSPRDKLDAEITRQMIAVCVLFCIFSITATTLYRFNYGSEFSTAYDLALFNFRDKVNSIVTSMINVGNFFSYMVFGKKFRADFKNLFCK